MKMCWNIMSLKATPQNLTSDFLHSVITAWQICEARFLVDSNPAGCMDVLSVVSVLCCLVEVYATDRSLVQRRSTECVCVCVCVIECDQMQH